MLRVKILALFCVTSRPVLISDKTESEGTELVEFNDDEPKCHRFGFFSRSEFKAAESENTAFIDLAQTYERAPKATGRQIVSLG